MTETIPHVIPITAENCHVLSPSALFAWSLNKVIEQGCRSISDATGGPCQYRGANGSKCAVGHCIPDASYNTSMEETNIRSIFEDPDSFRYLQRISPSLFEALQRFSRSQQIALYFAQLVHDCLGVKAATTLVGKSITDDVFADFTLAKNGNRDRENLIAFLNTLQCTEDFMIGDGDTLFDYKAEEEEA